MNLDRYFDPDPTQRAIARELYETVAALPLICPHGHVDPRLFADPDYSFGSPVDLLIIPDHYVFRMLYSQGVALEALGIPRRDGMAMETNHRKIWQTFADHYYLFRGTPTGVWFDDELSNIFGVEDKLAGASAQRVYDHITAQTGDAGVSPARLVRTLQHRGAVHHRCGHRSADAPSGYPRFGLDGQHSAHLPARWRGEPRRAGLAREHRRLERDQRHSRAQLRHLHSITGKPPGFLQVDGRYGHRSRRAHTLHARTFTTSGRRDLSTRPERRGHR